jgi:hypothetical protein
MAHPPVCKGYTLPIGRVPHLANPSPLGRGWLSKRGGCPPTKKRPAFDGPGGGHSPSNGASCLILTEIKTNIEVAGVIW